VICAIWILSYHNFGIERLADYNLNIIEHVAKVLDYYNKEKIVRIVSMLFENIMKDKDCMDLLSMINALNIVHKLNNRVWVDEVICGRTDDSKNPPEHIPGTLERLIKEFDANYQEFSSFDKWAKQVSA
jgi:hypothetical protein